MKEECEHGVWEDELEDDGEGGSYRNPVFYSWDYDIDLHRYQCSVCGRVGYYSKAARDYYALGIVDPILGEM